MTHPSAPNGKAHFIGICGAGMSGVAKLLQESGWEITGSDAEFYPPVSDAILRAGLNCQTPYAAANIPPDATRIVIGKHARLVPESNDEVREAFARRDRGTATIESYPEVVRDLTRTTHNIVVAGSYGKSSTTSLIAWILAHSGKEPSYFIGAVPMDFEFNARLATGEYFVLEGDEYPSANWDATAKFCYYNPQTVVLTSCEQDHFNAFDTEADYQQPFRRLMRMLSGDSLLIACRDGIGVPDVAREATCRIIWYSSAENESDADYRLIALEPMADSGMRLTMEGRFAAHFQGTFTVETHLLGRHNAQNIVGASAALLENGAVTPDEITAALRDFHGLRRRLERKTEKSSVAFYEDLSSSRPKAMAALRAVRERHPGSRVVALFQPHTFSFRSRQARHWYPGLFADADTVLVFSPPDLHGLPSGDEMSHDEILDAIRTGNTALVQVVRDLSEVLHHLRTLSPGDALLVMTSGGMGGIIAPVQSFLETIYPRAEY